MKKLMLLLLGLLLALTSCAPSTNDNDDKDEVLPEESDDAKQETSLVPSHKISKENYQIPIPYKTSAARGVITNQLGNRLDIDEMEEGLRRHSKSVFDPEKYLFEEGQYLSKDTVQNWLGRTMTDKEIKKAKKAYRKDNELDDDADVKDSDVTKGALNPPIEDIDLEDAANDEERENLKEEIKKAEEESPKYLSHILEQNFLKRKDDDTTELEGVSIGLALKSVYRFQTEQGGSDHHKDIPNKEIQKKGKEIAETVLERIRKIEGLEDVPVMIGLYREERQDSPVPGNFFATTKVKEGDMSIKEWEDVDEEYVLFPSNEAKEDHFEAYQVVEDFAEEISDYFPNFTGVIGEGFYTGDDLKNLTLEIPLDFYGKGEVVAFTQYVYGLVEDMFPEGYDLEIEISSTEKMESLIYRKPDEEKPSVHIFH